MPLPTDTAILMDRRVLQSSYDQSSTAPKRLWKELIRVGTFIHPVTKHVISVTPARLRHGCESGNEMSGSGVRVSINQDHNLSAENGLGRMNKYEVRGDGLYGEMEPADEEAEKIIRRNDVSIGFLPQYTDGNGKTWSDQIYHVAVTQLPVITDLQKATAASHGTAEWTAAIHLSADLTGVANMATLTPDHVKALKGHTHLCMENMSEDAMGDGLCSFHGKHAGHLSALKRAIPGMETCPPGDELPRAIQHLSTIKHIQDKIHGTHPHLLSMNASESQTAIDAKIDEWANASKSIAEKDTIIADLRKQSVELSNKVVKDVPVEAVTFIKEALASAKSKLIENGFKPHAAEMLFNRAAQGDKVNAVLCSAAANPLGGSRPLIFDLVDIITQGLGNPQIGSMTGGQHLSRTAPSETLIDNEATKAVMARMTASANSK